VVVRPVSDPNLPAVQRNAIPPKPTTRQQLMGLAVEKLDALALAQQQRQNRDCVSQEQFETLKQQVARLERGSGWFKSHSHSISVLQVDTRWPTLHTTKAKVANQQNLDVYVC
jgi:hypothetical protein